MSEFRCASGVVFFHRGHELVDLLILRAHELDRIADYERALGLAELRLREASAEGLPFLSLARARGSLHLFRKR